MLNICTIIAKNYLAHARVLAESFREHHPGGTCTVVVIDDPDGTIDAGSESFEILRIESVGIPALQEMLLRYDVTEFSTAVKPWVLKYLLERGARHIVYFDPDIQFFAPLDDVGELAEQHKIVLTPHTTEPMPRDGEKPTEADILLSGVYNLGFIAVGAGETATRFLDWWSERLLRDCLIDHFRALFVDQRWIDFVPSLFPDTKLLADPGCNVGYWNLDNRRLERDGDKILVNEEPLRFFHFSGFDPARPYWLSKHATRVRVTDNPVLMKLCQDYARLLMEHGYEDSKRIPYEYSQLPYGIEFDTRFRRIHTDAVADGEDFGNIFEPKEMDAFLKWLNAPAEKGGSQGVTRFMYKAIYKQRPDLKKAFANLDGPAGAQFANWVSQKGHRELDVPDQLMPTSSAERSQKRPAAKIDGVNVAGYLKAELGVGEAARQYIAALQSTGIPVSTKTFGGTMSRQNHDFAEITSSQGYSTNLICVNADQVPLFHREVGDEFFRGRRSIGVWAWEVNSFPEKWAPSFRFVDEIWVYSNYVAEILSRVSPKPVITIPPPVTAPEIDGTVVDLGVPEGFTFLFIFDFFSTMQRKNPLGLIEAFKRAFAPGEGPKLIIKSINGNHVPERLEQLKLASFDHSDIYLVDRYLSSKERTALMAGCDCYVSLHRSEGFGLTPAEAMALGKPVIATGFSGNTDFMTNSNSYLVNYTMTEVGPGSEPYPADGVWAEPDLDHAAALMRQVFESQDEARASGERAKQDIERMLSPQAVGKIARERLERLAELAALPALADGRMIGEGAKGQLEVAKKTLKQGPAVEAPSRLGHAGKFMRRLMFRVIRPFTFYQRELDTALIGAVQQTTQKIETVRSELLKAVQQTTQKIETVRSELLVSQEEFGKIEEHSGNFELDASRELRRLDTELSEVVAGIRARPAAGHPLLHYVDERGKVILGFRDAANGLDQADTYRAFEDVFRNEESVIRDRQAWYVDMFADYSWVLDVGCGRGEFLDLLRERGIRAVGVDLDESMVVRSRAKGHEVVLNDVNAYLREQDDGSIPAIFAAQLIEHLPYEDLMDFLRLANAKLETKGLFIVETINPHSPVALKAFWTDLSHQHPIFPEVALTLCRLAGFESGRVVFPNRTDDLEKELFSASDYAVIATKTPFDPGPVRDKVRCDAATEEPDATRNTHSEPNLQKPNTNNERELSPEQVRAEIAQVENWLHRIEVAPSIVTPGVQDSAAVLEAMGVPERLDGKRLLDVGARDGYFSFAAEARGAEVLAIDSVAPHLTGFATAAALLGSSVEYRTANVYDLRPEEVGTFDTIFFLGVLYHLRDPMLALDRLQEVARPGATIWVESHVIDQGLIDPATLEHRDLASLSPDLVDIPIAQFYPNDLLAGNPTNWWGPNLAGLKAMVEAAGFTVTKVQPFSGRGIIVGHRTESVETDFWRNFDRATGTSNEGMAWDRLRQRQWHRDA